MQIPKAMVEKLAKEWLAEAKRIRAHAVCDCGCGQNLAQEGRARFKPGHDAKLLSGYRRKIRAILSN